MNELKRRFYEWLDTKLIPEWDKSWKMLTVQFDAFMGMVVALWLSFPEADRASMAEMMGFHPAWLILAGVAVRFYLRLKPQPKLHEGEK